MAKIPDVNLQSPILRGDPEGTRQNAALVAKIQAIFLDIYSKLGKVRVVDAALVANQLDTIGDDLGNVYSEIYILDHATQSSRNIGYKNKAGTKRIIDSA